MYVRLVSEHRTREEWVVLTSEPDLDELELMRRGDMPNDAYRASLDLGGEHVDGGTAGVTYEVWVVSR